MPGPISKPPRVPTGTTASRPALATALAVSAFLACGTAAAATPHKADPALLASLKGMQMHEHGLAHARGGEFLIQNATSAGSVTGTANGAMTGHIVDNNSINGTGITSVFQNTGNNTLIQNTMTININVR